MHLPNCQATSHPSVDVTKNQSKLSIAIDSEREEILAFLLARFNYALNARNVFLEQYHASILHEKIPQDNVVFHLRANIFRFSLILSRMAEKKIYWKRFVYRFSRDHDAFHVAH